MRAYSRDDTRSVMKERDASDIVMNLYPCYTLRGMHISCLAFLFLPGRKDCSRIRIFLFFFFPFFFF